MVTEITKQPESMFVYNVRHFGANGKKEENSQTAIQQTIEACAAAGGGVVYFPPGDYTTGTIHLRSHVRIHVEAGATIYSSKEPTSFDQRALFYGEDLVNVTLEGRGVVDGQAEYEWHLMGDFRDWYIYPNQVESENGRGARGLVEHCSERTLTYHVDGYPSSQCRLLSLSGKR